MDENINSANISQNKEEYQQEESIDWRSLLFKCYLHWPWFVGCVLICFVGAWFYLHYATPVYKVSASVLIKEDDKKHSQRSNGMADLSQLGIFSSTQNFDNEIEVIHSRTLIKNVIEDLNLYSLYYDKSEIKKIELYKNSPIQVLMAPQFAEQLQRGAEFQIKINGNGSIDVTGIVDNTNYDRHFDRLPAVLPTHSGTFFFQANNRGNSDVKKLTAYVVNPTQLAKAYSGSLDVAPSSKTTTIALLSFKDTQRYRAADFINKLVEAYNKSTNDDKNEIATKTRQFIDNRIAIIDKELFSTEKDLENFKRESGLTDVKSDAELALTENSEYNKMLVENTTQLNIIHALNALLSNKGKNFAVLPTQTGLKEDGLSQQIDNYNKLVIDRNRLVRSSSESNPAIVNQDITIHASQDAIRATLKSIEKGLSITQYNLDKQTGKYKQRISKAPTQERQYLSISRQQEIKSQLYLMLLQKREENSIELASTANNAKIIDAATPDSTPVSPKRQLIYLVAFILGLAIPIGIIYLLDLLRYRIEGHADVEKLTKAPIIGDVPISEESRLSSVAVHENENNLMTETFRGIRTNLQFMLGDNKKVIMLTSTMSDEGKTFISTNLAISFALLGKKVILAGLDIRKPGLNKVFKISHSEVGLTQYLAHPETTDLHSLIRPSNIVDNLSLLPSGTVPPNPTELLDRPALQKAIDILRKEYDYVILDTAPIGMVSDTQLIGRVSDLAIYVCRADYTPKADYMFIEELRKQKRLPNICTVINGIDMKQKKYGYYYGYGKYGSHNYGYGKHYGYGYGYGYYDGVNAKKK